MRNARRLIAAAALTMTIGFAGPALTADAKPAAKGGSGGTTVTYNCDRLAKNVAAGRLTGSLDGYIACGLI